MHSGNPLCQIPAFWSGTRDGRDDCGISGGLSGIYAENVPDKNHAGASFVSSGTCPAGGCAVCRRRAKWCEAVA